MSINIRLFTFFCRTVIFCVFMLNPCDQPVLGHSSQSPKPSVHWLLKRSEMFLNRPLKFKNIGYCFDNLVPYSFDVSCLRPSALNYNTTVVPRLQLTNFEQLLPWPIANSFSFLKIIQLNILNIHHARRLNGQFA